MAERGGAELWQLLDMLSADPRRAYRVGITGAPGSGKSTLTMQLVRQLRAAHQSIAVIAVDPSSPFSHGALLGDRVRMNEVASDEEVFIRSMATRGAFGGLSAAVADAADIFDAAGYDYLLIETVGVGQNELEIAQATDSVLVVLTPESGDGVQMTKAGLMEIADLFVLNKDDRPGSEALHAALCGMLQVRYQSVPPGCRLTPVVRCTAQEGHGVAALHAAILEHRAHLEHGHALLERRSRRMVERIKHLVQSRLERELWSDERLRRLECEITVRLAARASVHGIAAQIFAEFQRTGAPGSS
jgi:LAO/AO transport system kinase